MIKNLTRGRIHKTSLFIQPEYKCDIGCKGCYAVKSASGSTRSFVTNISNLATGLKDDTIGLEQVTISLNGHTKENAKWAISKCTPVIKALEKDKLHYACAINSIALYKDIIDFDTCGALSISIDVNKYNKLNKEECAKACDAIHSIRIKHKDLHININLLALDDTVDSKDETVHDILEEAFESTDSTHLIMNKPISNLFNFEKIKDFKEDFENYLLGTLQIIEVLGSKFSMDSCVNTVLSNLLDDTTFTCRAGTDHVSLWPDGKFTGCAYRMPETEFVIGSDSTASFRDYDNIKDVDVAEFSVCLYNKLATLYGSFDELCKNLKLNKKEVTLLKSVIK